MKLFERVMAAALISAVLSGCASTSVSADKRGDKADAPRLAKDGVLPAQILRDGECGLFGFSASEQTLVFFSAPDRAAYIRADLTRGALTPQGEFPATDYGPVQLALGPSEALEGGLRYPQARLTDILPDGFTRVQPLVVLLTCEQPSA